MTQLQNDAILKQLGYVPNEALLSQIEEIKNNTHNYEKIEKHLLDLNEHLKVNNSHVAMSNSENYFKIKIGSLSDECKVEAFKKIDHFSDKFKVDIERVEGKDTFYVLGFKK